MPKFRKIVFLLNFIQRCSEKHTGTFYLSNSLIHYRTLSIFYTAVFPKNVFPLDFLQRFSQKMYFRQISYSGFPKNCIAFVFCVMVFWKIKIGLYELQQHSEKSESQFIVFYNLFFGGENGGVFLRNRHKNRQLTMGFVQQAAFLGVMVGMV